MPEVITEPGIDKFTTTVRSHDLDSLVSVILKSLDQGFDELRCFIFVLQKLFPPFSAVVVNHSKSVDVALDRHVEWAL